MFSRETENVSRKNHLGTSSLMFAILALSGCWIPFFNMLSVSAAIIGFLFGAWSLISFLRAKTKCFDRIILSSCAILMSVVAVITVSSVNHAVFSSYGGIKNFVIEVIDGMAGRNIGRRSQKSSINSTRYTGGVGVSQKTETSASQVYKIGESAEVDNRKVTLSDVQKNFSMNNEYSAPKEGYQFVKVVIKIENTSDSEILVSPQEFKIQDSSGTTESIVSATYLLDNRFESTTLAAGETVEGTMIFEAPDNNEDLKLIYQSSSEETKLEFDLQ